MNAKWKERLSLPIPAVRGAIKGMFWSAGTGTNYFTGRFEPEKARAVGMACRKGETAWDVGAHRGYMSLVIARAVGAGGALYSFEPDRSNLVFLWRHIRWNRLRQAKVLPVAVADYDGEARFKTGRSSLAGKLDGGGDVAVRVRSPRSLVESGECPPPTFLKIDAEGAEASILGSFGDLLRNPEICVVVSTDSAELHGACARILKEAGCSVVDSGKRDVPDAWKTFGDVELFAFGSARAPSEELVRAVRAIRG